MTAKCGGKLKTKRHWRKVRRWAMVLFMLAVGAMIIMAASRIDWFAVLVAIRKLPINIVMMALGLAVLGYLACSFFDVLGKRYTQHTLSTWRVLLTGFISYAFTMSLGSPAGLGVRMRLYNKQGLPTGTAVRIIAFSATTNWLGYLLLGGGIFMSGSVRLPESWAIGDGVLRIIGAGMVLISLAYLWLCAFSRRRSWRVWGHRIILPGVGMAVMQFGLAIFSWLMIGAIIYVLLQQEFAFFAVLGVLLTSAVAGMVMHIPGGIGVTESVFITLLPGQVSVPDMLGALLAYRAVYYVIPMALAGLMYLSVEAVMKTNKKSANS